MVLGNYRCMTLHRLPLSDFWITMFMLSSSNWSIICWMLGSYSLFSMSSDWDDSSCGLELFFVSDFWSTFCSFCAWYSTDAIYGISLASLSDCLCVFETSRI